MLMNPLLGIDIVFELIIQQKREVATPIIDPNNKKMIENNRWK